MLLLLLLLLSHFSRVRLCVTPQTAAYTRLPHPWDTPGKNTGVGCHFLLQGMKMKSESEVFQSGLTQRPHGLQPTRLLRPWDFPGKSSGVGCHETMEGVHNQSTNCDSSNLRRSDQNNYLQYNSLGLGVGNQLQSIY